MILFIIIMVIIIYYIIIKNCYKHTKPTAAWWTGDIDKSAHFTSQTYQTINK